MMTPKIQIASQRIDAKTNTWTASLKIDGIGSETVEAFVAFSPDGVVTQLGMRPQLMPVLSDRVRDSVTAWAHGYATAATRGEAVFARSSEPVVVIVVDDDPGILRSTTRFLKGSCPDAIIESYTVSTRAEARRVASLIDWTLRSDPRTVIVSDFDMGPGDRGIQLFEIYRSVSAENRFVFFSGSPRDQIEEDLPEDEPPPEIIYKTDTDSLATWVRARI